jgi:hypothetical protein
VLALAEWMEGNKELCKEIASDEASKKTSLDSTLNTKTFTLKLGNWELGEGFIKFYYACELMG